MKRYLDSFVNNRNHKYILKNQKGKETDWLSLGIVELKPVYLSLAPFP
jgi:hypothetical protein